MLEYNSPVFANGMGSTTMDVGLGRYLSWKHQILVQIILSMGVSPCVLAFYLVSYLELEFISVCGLCIFFPSMAFRRNSHCNEKILSWRFINPWVERFTRSPKLLLPPIDNTYCIWIIIWSSDIDGDVHSQCPANNGKLPPVVKYYPLIAHPL